MGYEGGSSADYAEIEQEVLKHAQQLHDKGVIDLDAPAREVIDAIQREFPADQSMAARAGGYWLVGDHGWCDHTT